MKNGWEAAVIGRIGKAPQFKLVGEKQTPALSFTLAVDQGTEQDEWVGVTLWADVAENLREALKPGDTVYAEGKARVERWTQEDGTQRAMVKLSARLCQPIGKIGRQPRKEHPSDTRKTAPSGPTRRAQPAGTTDRRGYDRGAVFE